MTAHVTDLTEFRRRFVRAKDDPTSEGYDPDSDDDPFMGIVCAEFAAEYDKIDCACCGSKAVFRGGSMRAPWKFGTVTSEKTGHLFGYAICEPCIALRKDDPDGFIARVDAAFEGQAANV